MKKKAKATFLMITKFLMMSEEMEDFVDENLSDHLPALLDEDEDRLDSAQVLYSFVVWMAWCIAGILPFARQVNVTSHGRTNKYMWQLADRPLCHRRRRRAGVPVAAAHLFQRGRVVVVSLSLPTAIRRYRPSAPPHPLPHSADRRDCSEFSVR